MIEPTIDPAYKNQDVFVLSLVGKDEIDLESEFGSVKNGLNAISKVIAEFITPECQFDIINSSSDLADTILEEQKVQNLRLCKITDDYLGDDDSVILQSSIGGTRIILEVAPILSENKSETQEIEIALGDSVLIFNRGQKTLTVTTHQFQQDDQPYFNTLITLK